MPQITFELVYKINCIQYYAQLVLAVFGLPTALLSLYVVVTQSPKHFKFFKHLLVCLIASRIETTVEIALIQPKDIPYYNGGYMQGPIGRHISSDFGYFTEFLFSASSVFIDSSLSIVGLSVQAMALKLHRPRFIIWLESGSNSKYFLATMIISVYFWSIAEYLAGFTSNPVLELKDEVLLKLKQVEPSLTVSVINQNSAKLYVILALSKLVISIGLNALSAYLASSEVEKNKAVLTKKTYQMQKDLQRFLIYMLIYNCLFFYIPVVMLQLSFLSPFLAYIVSPIASCVLITYGIVHGVAIIMHIKYYRNWVMLKLYGATGRSVVTVLSLEQKRKSTTHTLVY
ncbi:unnamed protein product [Bursaphelenchus okinawaensis]|uniref:Uncharacterized protein n=1 Tax=Bursaphelenchus okinawaensis TaxID=465554 RepID=A0A811L2A4_9BILA|nr:unnamed protein product [Bursaphelenchus okinawaensis]CAG9117365.1 unnamed protein product [Bursaphelenchus okinawaensis]